MPARPAAQSPSLLRRGQGRVEIAAHRASTLIDTRVIYCGDRAETRPSGSGPLLPRIDRLNLWHRFPTGEPATNRNYEVSRADRAEPRPSGSGSLLPRIDRLNLWHRSPTGEPATNRNYEVSRGDRAEPRPSASGPRLPFEDRRASTAAYIDFMRPRCVGPREGRSSLL